MSVKPPPKRKYTKKSQITVVDNNKDQPSKRTRSKKSEVNQKESNEKATPQKKNQQNNKKQISNQRKKAKTIKDLATNYIEIDSEVEEI